MEESLTHPKVTTQYVVKAQHHLGELVRNTNFQASEMAQWVKALSTKPDNPFDLQYPHGRRERTPAHSLLTSTHALAHPPQINNVLKKNKLLVLTPNL